MNTRRIALFVFFGLQLLAIGPLASAFGKTLDPHNGDQQAQVGAHCLAMGAIPLLTPVPTPVTPYRNPNPQHLTHPCPGMYPEPPFGGVSPLSISYVPDMCDGGNVFTAGYGDIGVWQNAGHSFVMISGFARAFYHIWNVDDPYNPVLLRSQPLPTGATASLSIFPFKKGLDRYMSVTLRGGGTGCGFFIYNVNDPANPQFVSRKQGSDWCTVHEHFISTDINGDADYAWLTMSGEGGSGIKVVVLDIHDLANPLETGRYQRPDSTGFSHDVTVIGPRVFLSHWNGGSLIFDKNTLAHSTNPTPLNPLSSIQPSGFRVHHSWPTSDGNHLFIEDEYESSPQRDKIKLYNIADVTNPTFEAGIIGPDTAQNNQAHNLKIKPISPGLDLLLDGWYLAGTRGFMVDYRNSAAGVAGVGGNAPGTTPTITQTLYHQLHQTANGGFGGVWGVDYMPCIVRGQATTCLYSSDLEYGLVVDALGVNPALDPYNPEVQVASPTEGQIITTCDFTMSGTSHDYWTGVQRIEVSIDGGPWQQAGGTNAWNYSWKVGANGPHQVQVRGVDVAGNTDLHTINVTVNADCPLETPTAAPSSTATSILPTLTTLPNTSTPTPLPSSTPTTPTTPTTAQPTSTQPAATASSVAATFSPTARPTATSGMTFTPAPTSTGVPTQGPSATSTSVGAGTPCAIQFADVPADNTFYSYVRCLACRGIIGGYPCGGVGEPCDPSLHPYFRYNQPVVRGQVSKMVSESAGFVEGAGVQVFSDVAPGSTFYVWVNRLANRHFMGGYPCGGVGEACDPQNRPYFRPQGYATRGQIAKIVAGAAYLSDPVSGQAFQDVPADNTFYVPVQQLVARNVMSGYPCGGPGEPCGPSNKPYFRPQNTVTRGQASKIVANTFFPGCQP